MNNPLNPLKFIIIGMIVLSFLSLATASLSCDQSQISQSIQFGNAVPSQTISCSRGVNDSITVSYVGDNFLSTNPATNFLMNVNDSIQINFNQNLPVGTYSGFLTFSNNNPIPIKLNISAPPQTTGCQINPSLVSYSQSIQQGTQVTLPKITFNPTNCPDGLVLTSSSVTIQGGIITPSGQKPVSIASIVSDGINLNIDTSGLTTQQTYTSYLNVNAFNKQFQIPFNIVVTSGTSPTVNFDVNNLPACSLTTTTLSLNSSYSLTCSNLSPDVTIVPSIDTHFIQGTGLQTSADQYIWQFKPVLSGSTLIDANFFYRGSPVGSPFSKSVTIQSATNSFPGHVINLLFSKDRDSVQNGDSIILQLTDNNTGSLLENSEIYINSLKLNSSDSKSFPYTFLSGVNYSIRSRSPGYDDLVLTYQLTEKNFDILIDPLIGDGDTLFNITTTIDNASLFLNGNKVNNPYYNTLPPGVNTIKAIKEGFIDTIINISVDPALSGTLQTEFKQNTPQTFALNKNASWYVSFQKDSVTPPSQISSGNSSKVDFTPKDVGSYLIYGNNKLLTTQTIQGWDGTLFGIAWYWVVGGAVLIILFIIWRVRQRNSYTPGMSFGGAVNTVG